MARPIVVTRHVAAPPARVFELFADIGHAAERVQGIEKVELLTDGPVGVGTRFRETRRMFGKEASEVMEFAAFDPGRAYTVVSDSCGCDVSTDFTFTASGEGTDVRMEMLFAPRTLMAKLMSPLQGLMSGMAVKCIEADFADLAALAEGEAREAVAAG